MLFEDSSNSQWKSDAKPDACLWPLRSSGSSWTVVDALRVLRARSIIHEPEKRTNVETTCCLYLQYVISIHRKIEEKDKFKKGMLVCRCCRIFATKWG